MRAIWQYNQLILFYSNYLAFAIKKLPRYKLDNMATLLIKYTKHSLSLSCILSL